MGSTARYQPVTVDSIVPRHLFDRPQGDVGLGAGDEDGASRKSQGTMQQAAAAISKFLESNYFYLDDPPKRRAALEGRLQLSALLPSHGLSTGFSPGFSAGLPSDIVASWDGPWQVDPVMGGGPPPIAGERSSGSAALTAALRLNGAVGTIHFSRPVVLRRLLVRPPLDAESGRQLLVVRGRNGYKEVWRREYDYHADTGPAVAPLCSVGDMVFAGYGDKNNKYPATVLSRTPSSATLRWFDNDHARRVVGWPYITTADGVPCKTGWQALPAQGLGEHKQPVRSWWRDLAKRVRSVTEISFTVLHGDPGWLLGDLAVAAMGQPKVPEKKNSDGATKSSKKDADDTDFHHHVVQVLPGPFATISEVSSAAVFFNADEMLRGGFRLRTTGPAKGADLGMDAEEDDTVVTYSSAYSLEGFKRLLWALAEPRGAPKRVLRLPAGITKERFLADAQLLVRMLADAKSLVKRFGRIDSWFAMLWDVQAPVDSLHPTYERWRWDAAQMEESAGAFAKGQRWEGHYVCSQGPTRFALQVTDVTLTGHGSEWVQADLTFWLDELGEQEGSYSVAGVLEPVGRALNLEPLPGSWKSRPKDFVMVGFEGVVSRYRQPPAEAGGPSVGETLRFAGSVPNLGCDGFELTLDLAPTPIVASEEAPLPAFSIHDHLWNAALARLSRSIDAAREEWWVQLHELTNEKPTTTKTETLAAQMAAQLLEGLKVGGGASGTTTVEVTTESGEEIVIQISKADQDVLAQLVR